MSRDVCPICGAELPKKAKACPECGSCEETGWSDDAQTSGLDLPDDEFNYDKFVKSEFGSSTEMKPRGLHWFWWATGVVLLLGMLYWMFVRIF
jgi:hypothetical protein